MGTFILAVVGWVLFRAESFTMAGIILGKMFWFSVGSVTVVGRGSLIVLLAVAGAIAHFCPNAFELKHEWSPAGLATIAGLFVLSVLVIYGAAPAPFLYFQF